MVSTPPKFSYFNWPLILALFFSAESGSLQTTLRQFGQLPEGLVASYVVKILEGLSYLHEQGVVHCDLKGSLLF
jgi:serine/threonine protein kinase